MQKALFVYLNILHCLDKSSFIQYLAYSHTQAQNDMFLPYAYCLLVSSLKQVKVNEMKQNIRKKLYMFISNKKDNMFVQDSYIYKPRTAHDVK